MINKGRTNYFPNSLGGGFPKPGPARGRRLRPLRGKGRGPQDPQPQRKFRDFFSQARLFWNSLSDPRRST
jgi:catalase